MKIGLLLPAVILFGFWPASAGQFSQLQGPEEQLALLSAKAGLSIPANATPLEMLRIVFAAIPGKPLPAGLKARYVGDAFLNSDDRPADTLPPAQGGANTVLNLDGDKTTLAIFAGDPADADRLPKGAIESLMRNSPPYSKAENKATGTFLISYADAPYPGGFRALELRQLGPFVVGVSRRDDLGPEYGGIETYFLFYKRIDKWALFPAVLSRAKNAAKALQN